MIQFARETLASVLADARFETIGKHWEELGRWRESVPLDPDWTAYQGLEARDELRAYTVRDGRMLLGYASYFVRPHLNYKSTLYATGNVFWLSPEIRGKGVGSDFFAWIERELTSELPQGGVMVMLTPTKRAHPAAGQMLESLGHEASEIVYAKLLSA